MITKGGRGGQDKIHFVITYKKKESEKIVYIHT